MPAVCLSLSMHFLFLCHAHTMTNTRGLLQSDRSLRRFQHVFWKRKSHCSMVHPPSLRLSPHGIWARRTRWTSNARHSTSCTYRPPPVCVCMKYFGWLNYAVAIAVGVQYICLNQSNRFYTRNSADSCWVCLFAMFLWVIVKSAINWIQHKLMVVLHVCWKRPVIKHGDGLRNM